MFDTPNVIQATYVIMMVADVVASNTHQTIKNYQSGQLQNSTHI